MYSSDYFEISKMNNSYLIKALKNGITMDMLNSVLNQYPQIKLTNITAIRSVITGAIKEAVKFGEQKEKIEVEISSDSLKAYITLCVDQEELENDKVKLVRDIVLKLRDCGVVYGVKHEAFLNPLSNFTKFLVAEGTLPVNGEDSVIRMYEVKEAKPEVREDGNVDHYELNLINKVHKGEWLGERYDPTLGKDGKTVRGDILKARNGRKIPLHYDKKSIREVYQNGVTTLLADRNGAVFYQGGKIAVSNYLEIGDNVDFKTGNVDFDGFLTVKGSVEDNFSVVADNDIEILGDYGIGSVKEIESRGGSIYVKGGIAGKNKAVIRSEKNIYTKYVADATIFCKGSVHIGFYCLNSFIVAKEVILDSGKGNIIGGNIEAEIIITTPTVGNRSERKTNLTVKGFNREALRDRLTVLMEQIEKYKDDITKCKQEMTIYTNAMETDPKMGVVFEEFRERFFEMRTELTKAEEEFRDIKRYLKTKGEGEIYISKVGYPGTVIEIKGNSIELNKEVISTSYYTLNNQLRLI